MKLVNFILVWIGAIGALTNLLYISLTIINGKGEVWTTSSKWYFLGLLICMVAVFLGVGGKEKSKKSLNRVT